MVHKLRCPVACEVFVDRRPHLCPVHWQAILIQCAPREVLPHAFLMKRALKELWVCEIITHKGGLSIFMFQAMC